MTTIRDDDANLGAVIEARLIPPGVISKVHAKMSDRETGQDEDHQMQTPVWQVPSRKNRRGDLNDDTARDDVGDGHAVNFSALQSSKKPLIIKD